MKNLIFYFLFLASTIGLCAQKYIAIITDDDDNSVHYVIDNKVNVRAEPSLSGEKLFQLNLGDAVEIIGCREEWGWILEGGYYAPWYRIVCEKGRGYICGRYISCKEAVGDIDNDGEDEIFAATKNGIAIRFSEKDVRSMGAGAAGVRGINLRDEDKIVGAAIISSEMNKDDARILTITEEGYGKRTKLLEYRLTSRGGKGIINAKLNEKTGKIVDVKIVKDDDEIMLITSEGTLIRTSVKDVSVIGRSATGVRIMKVRNNEKIASIVKITEEPKLDDEVKK